MKRKRISQRSGDSQVMKPGMTGTLVRLRWEDGDFEPLPVRVSVSVEDAQETPKTWAESSFVRLVARLSWGNDGGGGTVEMDVRRGTVACIQPCQSMQVEIDYLKAPDTFVDGPPLRVSVTAVQGDAPPQRAIKSEYLGLVAGPTTETAPRRRIPAFADRALILASDTANRPSSGLYLYLYGDNNGGPLLASYDLAERSEAIIPQGAEFYTVYVRPPVRQRITTTWLVVS